MISNEKPDLDRLQLISGNMYPGSQQDRTQYATPTQMPAGAQAVAIKSDYDAKTNPITGEPMASFAGGGIMQAAEQLQAKGRGNDDHLVHMSGNELKGLQDLAMAHGGSLSINPHTGLPEAGFLEQILPVVAAGAATYLTAGAAAPYLATALGSSAAGGILAGAGAGALISGGTAALQHKDVGNAALMGGLGGAIAGGLGAYTPADAAAGVVPGTTDSVQQQLLTAPSQTGGFTGYQQALGSSTQTTPANAMDYFNKVGTPGNIPTGITAAPTVAPPTSGPTFYSGLEPNGIGRLGVQSLPVLGLMQEQPLNPIPQTQYDPNNPMRWRLSNTFQGSTPVQPNPYYKATYSVGGSIGEVQQLPKGDPGIFYDSDANTKGLGAFSATQYQLKKLGKKFNVPMSAGIKSGIKDLGGDMSDNAAAGGTASLGGYSDGGRMLKGPGDGMSDSIPATIGHKQPARLADGEFVVPADVVSHLGNGSTDAGAKKLYGMMDKIRKARTGKKKQAPAIKADKFMPK